MSYQTGQVVDMTAGGVAHGGWCVARPADGPVVFVRHALPGERVRARITEVTSRLARAEAVEILIASPDRVKPPCPYAAPGGCGGCDWQHAALPAQRSLKAAVVREQLRRLAGIDREVTVEPLPGDADGGESLPGGSGGGLGWRTRVQFAVREDGVAGLHAHRSHQVINVSECLIAHPAIMEMAILGHRWPGMASVEALVGTGPGETAVIVSAGRTRASPDRSVSIEGIAAGSVLRRAGRSLTPMRGRSYLAQRAAGRDWRVSAGAFWQVHPAAADALAGAVMAGLRPVPGDVALDLYCGVGLFAGVLARAVGPGGTVIGIEADRAAVRDARHNLREWPWVRVHQGDVAAVLARGADPPRPPREGMARGADPPRPPREGMARGAGRSGLGRTNPSSPPDPPGRGDPSPRTPLGPAREGTARGADPPGPPRGARQSRALPPARLVVADPPRSGLAREVIEYLGAPESGAGRFAYVSCDPATLARDIGRLTARGWVLDGLRAFDAFPMTHHVECVATLAAPE